MAEDRNDAERDESTVEFHPGDETEALRAELAETREKLLRERAELDNYRKRAKRELEDERRYANLPLFRDLVPVVDNIERAIESSKTPDANALLEGFKMVAQQLEGVLQKYHCRRIAAMGEMFDPHQHEAVMQQPSDEPPHTVIGIGQSGFQLHDRVVRPAQVIVAAPKPSQP